MRIASVLLELPRIVDLVLKLVTNAHLALIQTVVIRLAQVGLGVDLAERRVVQRTQRREETGSGHALIFLHAG